ncbi:hypothetical protein LZ31DRAFT_344869 [Colletotrichum somersetense]|nr:hypothetical protein LZ31DRAFT_344869 [Colletotrichum somersetense]
MFLAFIALGLSLGMHRPWPFVSFAQKDEQDHRLLAANPKKKKKLCKPRRTRLGSVIVGLVRPINEYVYIGRDQELAAAPAHRRHGVPEAVTASINVRPRLVSCEKMEEGLCRVGIHPPCSTCVRCATEGDAARRCCHSCQTSQIRRARKRSNLVSSCTIVWTGCATQNGLGSQANASSLALLEGSTGGCGCFDRPAPAWINTNRGSAFPLSFVPVPAHQQRQKTWQTL